MTYPHEHHDQVAAVPLSRDDVAELVRMVLRGYATPGQASALFGIDRRDVAMLTGLRRPARTLPAPCPGRPLACPRRGPHRPDVQTGHPGAAGRPEPRQQPINGV